MDQGLVQKAGEGEGGAREGRGGCSLLISDSVPCVFLYHLGERARPLKTAKAAKSSH